jgi:hypothetical protein
VGPEQAGVFAVSDSAPRLFLSRFRCQPGVHLENAHMPTVQLFDYIPAGPGTLIARNAISGPIDGLASS